ncbi:hypothetical protein AAVH_27698 [Aphelenchoides avenae]|nr:hypothetical protein AAVH_27698 [Aphelenchus avenae]
MAEIILTGAGFAIGVGEAAKDIKDAANRTVMIVNEDDHPIQFEFAQKDDSRGKHMIQPGQWLQVDFLPNVTTKWWCNAWFNGPDQEPMKFDVWEGHGSSKKYTVRKQVGVYKAEIDGSGEHVHVKFD